MIMEGYLEVGRDGRTYYVMSPQERRLDRQQGMNMFWMAFLGMTTGFFVGIGFVTTFGFAWNTTGDLSWPEGILMACMFGGFAIGGILNMRLRDGVWPR